MQALTRAHRADLQKLTGLAAADLELIWRRFNIANAIATRDGLAEVLPRLVAIYGAAAATLGADYYDEMRDAAKVKGRFAAVAAELPDVGRTDALAGWGVGPLFSATPDSASALTLVTGGLQQIIAGADRGSITASSVADPRARGWQRVGSGRTCAWCRMMIDRGDVYTEASVTFEAHDHDQCGAEPVFE